MQITAKEKLIEKHIDWQETYTEKTAFLKRQFEDVIGEGSYYRFEGEASDGDRYYCIVGPAQIHHPKAKFFAGVRKLPATYSAGGKYFDSMDRAAAYAEETWGVSRPKSLRPYTSAQLHGISAKVTQWKKEHGEDHELDDDKKDKSEKSEKESTTLIQIKEGSNMSNKHVPFNLSKKAMALEQLRRGVPSGVWRLQDIIAGKVAKWNDVISKNQTYNRALTKIVDRAEAIRAKLARRYGLSSEEVDQVYHPMVGYYEEYGIYAYSLGPYFTEDQKIYTFIEWAKKNGFNGKTDIQEAIDVGLRINNPIATNDKDSKTKVYDTSVKDGTVPDDTLIEMKPGSVANFANYVNKDRKNRFIPTKQRFQETSEDELNNTVLRYIISNLPEFLGIITEEDLKMMIGGSKKAKDIPKEFKKFTAEEAMAMKDEDIADLEAGDDEEPDLEVDEIPGAEGVEGQEIEDVPAAGVPDWFQEKSLNDPALRQTRQVAGEGVSIQLNTGGIKKILEAILSGTSSPIRQQVMKFMVANQVPVNVNEKGKVDIKALYTKLMSTEDLGDDLNILRDMRLKEKKFREDYKAKKQKGGQTDIIKKGLKLIVSEIGEVMKKDNLTLEQVLAQEQEKEAKAVQGQGEAIRVREDMINMAMTKLSQEEGGKATFDEIKAGYQSNDKKILGRIYEQVRMIQSQMIADGDPRVAFMKPIAKIGKLKRLKMPIGAQRFETLRTPPVVEKQLATKASLYRVMNDMLKANPNNPNIIRDPVALTNALNKSRAGLRKVKEFLVERDVPYWLKILDDDIRKAEASGVTKTMGDLLADADKEYRDAEMERRNPMGTASIHECFAHMNMYLQGGDEDMIDAETGGLLSYNPDVNILPIPENFPNWVTPTMTARREEAEKKQAPIVDIDQEQLALIQPDDEGIAEEVRALAVPVDDLDQAGAPEAPAGPLGPEEILAPEVEQPAEPVAEGEIPPVDLEQKPEAPDFPIMEVPPQGGQGGMEQAPAPVPAPVALKPKRRVRKQIVPEPEDGPNIASTNSKIVLAKTLSNLKVIAKELRNEGKTVEAEEVNQMIRKYDGQIGNT